MVHYHPVDDSYSAALCRAVCDALESRGAPYRLVRLHRGETADRRRLADTEHLIAVYPTWWGGLPARLLDWLQKTLGPDIDGPGLLGSDAGPDDGPGPADAVSPDGPGQADAGSPDGTPPADRPVGNGPSSPGGPPASPSVLARVRRLTVVATHGSGRLKNTVQGEPGRKLWKRTILGLCAPGAAFGWVALYDLDRLDRADLERFVETARASVAEAAGAQAPGPTSAAAPA